MQLRTELKCYSCSRVCGEAAGDGEDLGRLVRVPNGVSPGPHCGLEDRQLKCGRCGTLVYLGETHTEIEPYTQPPAARARPVREGRTSIYRRTRPEGARTKV